MSQTERKGTKIGQWDRLPIKATQRKILLKHKSHIFLLYALELLGSRFQITNVSKDLCFLMGYISIYFSD